MAKFVEFTNGRGGPIWVNPELVCSVESDTINSRVLTAIVFHDRDNPYWVTETVPEVLAKLQGEQPQPAPAADDIVGWWCENVTGARIYVIGKDSGGFYTYEMEENLILRSRPDVIRQHYFRDPNRKGWDE